MTIVDATYYVTDGMPEWSDNPLVAALGTYRSPEELRRDLYRNPYAGRDFSSMPVHLRHAAVDELTTSAFAVSPRELEFAALMQRMLWTGLARRNPRQPEVMSSIAKFSLERGKSLDLLPWSSTWADAAKVGEITGTGKTHIPTRILQLWPKAIRHGKLEGVWKGWLQLGHLHLDMSYDGNLNGLLLHILNEVDLAFDHTTDYAQRYPKVSKNIQERQIWVIDVLKRHFCGFLVMDELQAISLLLGRDSRLVANFFLRLLNQCIPILFEGNPFAFSPFESVSQLWDRLHTHLFPSLLPDGIDDEDFRDHFLPQIWEMQVMTKKAPLTDSMIRAIYDCSAFHPRHVTRALQNAQHIALALGCACLEERHFTEGFRHMVDSKIQQRITAFVERNPIGLLQWEDIPVAFFAAKWGVQDQTVMAMAADHDKKFRKNQDGESAATRKDDAHEKSKVTLSQMAAMEQKKTKARITRTENKKRKNSIPVDTTDEKDIRKQGIRSTLVQGFDALPSATQSRAQPLVLEKPPKSGRKK